MIGAMRTALLLVLTLAMTGCWKEIHEASGSPPLDRRAAVADATAAAGRRV